PPRSSAQPEWIPILTFRAGPDQSDSVRPSWMASAAATAAGGEGNATPKPSPAVEKTWPPWAAAASLTRESWWAMAVVIPAGSDSHSRVDPSTSVNRNVTDPVGGVMERAYRAGLP